MTTVELAQHIAPVTRIRDVTASPLEDRQELALIMTQAMAEFYAFAPSCYRKTTLSKRLPDPEDILVEMVAGSAEVVGAPFLPSNRGCSISFPDGSWNEIVSPGRLLHSWGGVSGEVMAKVWPDCIAFDDFLIERICSHPEATMQNGSAFALSPWAKYLLPIAPSADGYGGTLDQRREVSSNPVAYWSEFIGGTHQVENDALFQFRFWPIPATGWLCSFDAEVMPLPYRLGHLSSPSTIPVPDPVAQRLLIPLARGKAARSFLYDKDRTSKGDLLDDMEIARDGIRNLAPIFAPSDQFIGTPDGW
jgi:hypothetical protein